MKSIEELKLDDIKLFLRMLKKDFTYAQIADELGITKNQVFKLMNKVSYLDLEEDGEIKFNLPAGMIREVLQLCSSYRISGIIRRTGLPRLVVQLIIDYYGAEVRKRRFNPSDPRSAVCQQIPICSHDRCYLHVRCPAYAAWRNRRQEQKSKNKRLSEELKNINYRERAEQG